VIRVTEFLGLDASGRFVSTSVARTRESREEGGERSPVKISENEIALHTKAFAP